MLLVVILPPVFVVVVVVLLSPFLVLPVVPPLPSSPSLLPVPAHGLLQLGHDVVERVDAEVVGAALLPLGPVNHGRVRGRRRRISREGGEVGVLLSAGGPILLMLLLLRRRPVGPQLVQVG